MDRELETFKTAVNLVAYAQSQGYQLNRRRSTQISAVLSHSDGHKIVVSRFPDGHWVYFTVGDDGRDSGSIIDFVKNRLNLNLGQVRKHLRDWAPGSIPINAMPELKIPKPLDRERIQKVFSEFRPFSQSRYLQIERKIDDTILLDKRFRGTIFENAAGEIIFAHHDESGLCGFERKGPAGAWFSAGGARALWSANVLPGDDTIVITESPIDALSHYQLFPNPAAQFVATCGAPGPEQWKQLLRTIDRLPNSRVVAAFDADETGDNLADKVRVIVGDSRFRRARPPQFKDWNEELIGEGRAKK